MRMPELEQRFYTTEEAATLSRFSLPGLAARRSRGLPPEWRRVGGKVLYPVEPFEAWLAGESTDEDQDAVGG